MKPKLTYDDCSGIGYVESRIGNVLHIVRICAPRPQFEQRAAHYADIARAAHLAHETGLAAGVGSD